MGLIAKPERLRGQGSVSAPAVAETVEDWVEQGKEDHIDEKKEKRPRRTTSIVIDEDFLKDIKIYCVENNTRFNAFVEDALRTHFNSLTDQGRRQCNDQVNYTSRYTWTY